MFRSLAGFHFLTAYSTALAALTRPEPVARSWPGPALLENRGLQLPVVTSVAVLTIASATWAGFRPGTAARIRAATPAS